MVTWHKLSFLICFALSAKVNAKESFQFTHSEVTLRMKHAPTGGFETIAKDAITPKNLHEPLNFDVSKLSSLVTLRDEHMKKVLNAKKFPQIILRNLKIDSKNKTFEATLMVMGKEATISGNYTTPTGNTAIAIFQSKMTLYGISPQIYMGIGVKDDFEVTIKLTNDSSPTNQDEKELKVTEDPLDLIDPNNSNENKE